MESTHLPKVKLRQNELDAEPLEGRRARTSQTPRGANDTGTPHHPGSHHTNIKITASPGKPLDAIAMAAPPADPFGSLLRFFQGKGTTKQASPASPAEHTPHAAPQGMLLNAEMDPQKTGKFEDARATVVRLPPDDDDAPQVEITAGSNSTSNSDTTACASETVVKGRQPVDEPAGIEGSVKPFLAIEDDDLSLAHMVPDGISAPISNTMADTSTTTVTDAIEAFALAERLRNFHFLARNNHHAMNDKELRVYLACLKQIEHISQWGLRNTVPIRWIASRHAVAEVKVENMEVWDVEDTKIWMPLVAWMRKQFEWHDEYVWKMRGGPQLQLENQIMWWKNNGKSFRIMDLPLEMRELIYLQILGGGIVLPKVDGNRVTMDNGLTIGPKDRTGFKRDPDIAPPYLPFLQVRRQIYEEAKKTIWTAATKRFHATSDLNGFSIPIIHHYGHPQALNRIQLEFSAALYFQLVGIRPRFGAPFGNFVADPRALTFAQLKALETVQHLDFRFISPKHPKAADPWDTLYRAWADTTVHSCQKEWIDWFFTFALEQLCGWNTNANTKLKITMSGCIKDFTRTKWARNFKIVASTGLETTRILREVEVAKQEILRTRVEDLPIKCNCTLPCSATNLPTDGYNRFINNPLLRRFVKGLDEEILENYWSFKD
ncbi:hypothetical protein BU23DRAFT_604019 [Bimuria novae-zelandiae CBS 107.79]|uniref:Uncharacterized protein n=1 Tax=Bimuria novae-zelandiae CBS 107.79 TaxID=1447943 RepID=A0A6A5UMT4_9PLEO|nr:hypothetical protein BU23DRAFT_604019 [Bimuria novae-zelandiae CBS 107.79]